MIAFFPFEVHKNIWFPIMWEPQMVTKYFWNGFFFFLKSGKKEEPEQSVPAGMRNPNGWSSTTTYHIDSYFSTEFLSWEHVNSSKSMEINQLLSAPTRYEPLTLNAWNEHSKRLAFSGNGRRVNQSESLTRIESISWNVMIHDGFDHSLKIPWLMFDTMTKLDIFFSCLSFFSGVSVFIIDTKQMSRILETKRRCTNWMNDLMTIKNPNETQQFH